MEAWCLIALTACGALTFGLIRLVDRLEGGERWK